MALAKGAWGSSQRWAILPRHARLWARAVLCVEMERDRVLDPLAASGDSHLVPPPQYRGLSVTLH